MNLQENIQSAIEREKQMKRWKREWKIRLIKEFNPEWKDLFDEISNGFLLRRNDNFF